MEVMKTTILKVAAIGMILLMGVSCTTSYDAYGRPMQTVDPGLATLGVVAAGVAGYALANRGGNRGYRNHNRHYNHPQQRYHRSNRGYYQGNCRRGWY
jgi:hypothetical protein